MPGILLILGLFLQNILGYAPLDAGYILLALTLTFGILSIPAGKLVDAVGTTSPIIMGFILLTIGNLIFALLTEAPALSTVLIALFIEGVAIALLIPSTGTAALQTVPKEHSGSAMGVFLTNAFIGGGIGVAVTGWLLSSRSRHSFYERLHAITTPLTDYQTQAFVQAANGIHSLPTVNATFPSPLVENIAPIVHHAFMSGFTTIMWLFVGVSVISCLLSLKLRKVI